MIQQVMHCDINADTNKGGKYMENLTVQDVLKRFSISRATLYRMIDEGLPYTAVGTRKKIFEEEKVKAFIEARKNAVVSKIKLGREYTNAEVSEIFNANLQRGMKKSNTANALVLMAKHEADNLYDDYWDNEGIFYYTGMGFEGDQQLDFYENKTLSESDKNGVTVYLFEKFEGHEFIYRGIVELANPPFQQEEKDMSGKIRKVWKFPLRFVGEQYTIPRRIIDEHQKRVEENIKNKKLSIDDLREKAEAVSKYNKSSTRSVISSVYERNEYIKEYSLYRARGKCELCRKDAPFVVDNEPYLESHHIVWLSRGGEDTIDNTSAVCPNCHRKLHLLDLKEDVKILIMNVKQDEDIFQHNISSKRLK